jgi:hypothetical protein
VKWKRVPPPGLSTAAMVPPWRSTTRWQIARPQPGARVADVGALEGSEYLFMLAGRDADAAVHDVEVDPVVRFVAGAYLDVGSLVRGELDVPLRTARDDRGTASFRFGRRSESVGIAAMSRCCE